MNEYRGWISCHFSICPAFKFNLLQDCAKVFCAFIKFFNRFFIVMNSSFENITNWYQHTNWYRNMFRCLKVTLCKRPHLDKNTIKAYKFCRKKRLWRGGGLYLGLLFKTESIQNSDFLYFLLLFIEHRCNFSFKQKKKQQQFFHIFLTYLRYSLYFCT